MLFLLSAGEAAVDNALEDSPTSITLCEREQKCPCFCVSHRSFTGAVHAFQEGLNSGVKCIGVLSCRCPRRPSGETHHNGLSDSINKS